MLNDQTEEIYVIGDIHGCANELKSLIETLPLAENCIIVFLGDLIDRGPHSRQVIDYVIELSKKYEVVTLMGNHEAMFLDFIKAPRSQAAGRFIFNGGGATLASYGDGTGHYDLPDEHAEFFDQLLPFYETEDYFFVHGGVPNIPLNKISLKKHGTYMLWARDDFLKSNYDWGKTIVHGHTPHREVEQTEGRINLDTGCVYGNKLSCMRLSDQKLFQVKKTEDEKLLPLQDSSSKRRGVRYNGVIPVEITTHNARIVAETLDYNEFGLFVREISNLNLISLNEDDVIQVKISTHPNVKESYQSSVVRVQKNGKDTYYALKFIENPVQKKSGS